MNVSREISLARGGGPLGLERRVVKLEAGVDMVTIDGVYIVRDRHCTANTLYAWNTEYVAIRQLNPMQSILRQGADGVQEFFRELMGNPELVLPRAEVEGMAAKGPGIRPHIRMLGDRGDSTEAMILCYAQVEWTRRNAFGKLTVT